MGLNKCYAKTKSFRKKDKWYGVWRKHNVPTLKAGLRGFYDIERQLNCNCGNLEFGFDSGQTATRYYANEVKYERVHEGSEIDEDAHWRVGDWYVKSIHFSDRYGYHMGYRYTNQ